MESYFSGQSQSELNSARQLAVDASALSSQIKGAKNEEQTPPKTIKNLEASYQAKILQLENQLQALCQEELLQMDMVSASPINSAIASQLSKPEGSFVREVETIGAQHRDLGSGTPDDEFSKNCSLARIFAFIGQEVPSCVKKVILIQQIVDKKTKELLPRLDGGGRDPLSEQNQESVDKLETLLKRLPASLFERPIGEIQAVVNGLLALDEKQQEPAADNGTVTHSLEHKLEPLPSQATSLSQDQAIEAITKLYDQVSLGFSVEIYAQAVQEIHDHSFGRSISRGVLNILETLPFRPFAVWNGFFRSETRRGVEHTFLDLMMQASKHWLSGVLSGDSGLDADHKQAIQKLFTADNFKAAIKQYIVAKYIQLYPNSSNVAQLIHVISDLNDKQLWHVSSVFESHRNAMEDNHFLNLITKASQKGENPSDIIYYKEKLMRALICKFPSGISENLIQLIEDCSDEKKLIAAIARLENPQPFVNEQTVINSLVLSSDAKEEGNSSQTATKICNARRFIRDNLTSSSSFNDALNLLLEIKRLKKSSHISQDNILNVIRQLQRISDVGLREHCFASKFKRLLTKYFKQHDPDSTISGYDFFPTPDLRQTETNPELTDDRLNVISYVMSNDYIYSSLCLEEGESTLDSIKKSENLVLFFSNLSIDARKAAVNSVFGEDYVAEFVADIFKDLQGLYKARQLLQDKIDNLQSDHEKRLKEKLSLPSETSSPTLKIDTYSNCDPYQTEGHSFEGPSYSWESNPLDDAWRKDNEINKVCDKLNILNRLKDKCEENIVAVMKGEATNADTFKGAVQKELNKEKSKLQTTRDCGFWTFFNTLLSIFSSRKTKSAAVVDDAFAAVNSGAGFFRSAEESVSASSALSFEPSSVARFGDYDEESYEVSDEVSDEESDEEPNEGLDSEVSRRFSQ